MLDLKSIAARDRISCLRIATRVVLTVALLLAVIAWVADAPFARSAAAQSSEPQLNAVQRRLVRARLTDSLKKLKRDVERGQKRVHASLDSWTGDEGGLLVKEVFDQKTPAPSIPNASDNIYEGMIREYVAFKRKRREPWNSWPADISINDQREYVSCVLKRIDYYFETKWQYMRMLIDSIKDNGPPPELNDLNNPGAPTTRKKAIRAALTFNGGISQYLRNVPISQALPRRPDDEDLDPLRKCPIKLDSGAGGETAVGTLSVSVDWTAKCLQADKLQPDGKVKPYHPTTAALMYDNGTGLSTYCSGTLIAPNAVLTAAHCVCETAVKDPSGPFYRTAGTCVAGGYSRLGRGVSTLDPRNQKVFLQHAGLFDISHILVHPQFRWTDDLPSSDLAILFLDSPVPGIAPMPLNSLRRLPPNTPAEAVGYGAHNPIGATGAITDTATVLEQAGLKLQAHTVTAPCSLRARSRNLICWSYRPQTVGMQLGSTCRGDSGGPLYAESGNQTYLVGVTSGGGPSCLPSTQAYDTEVYSYREWILKQLALNAPPPQRGSFPTAKRGSDGMNQFACHFCSLCDDLEATIKTPNNARRVQISVNCTPDQANRRSSEFKLEVSELPKGSHGVRRVLCLQTGPKGTALACDPFLVQPNQGLNIKLNTGLLQQCQIVATSSDGPD